MPWSWLSNAFNGAKNAIGGIFSPNQSSLGGSSLGSLNLPNAQAAPTAQQRPAPIAPTLNTGGLPNASLRQSLRRPQNSYPAQNYTQPQQGTQPAQPLSNAQQQDQIRAQIAALTTQRDNQWSSALASNDPMRIATEMLPGNASQADIYSRAQYLQNNNANYQTAQNVQGPTQSTANVPAPYGSVQHDVIRDSQGNIHDANGRPINIPGAVKVDQYGLYYDRSGNQVSPVTPNGTNGNFSGGLPFNANGNIDYAALATVGAQGITGPGGQPNGAMPYQAQGGSLPGQGYGSNAIGAALSPGGSNIGGVDYSQYYTPAQIQGLQQMAQTNQRLQNLSQAVAQTNVQPKDLLDLNNLINQNQLELAKMNPQNYLASNPTLSNVGITEGALEGRIEYDKTPLESALSQMLVARSAVQQSWDFQKQVVGAQYDAASRQAQFQQNAFNMIPGMSESTRTAIQESQMGLNLPPDYRTYVQQMQGAGKPYMDILSYEQTLYGARANAQAMANINAMTGGGLGAGMGIGGGGTMFGGTSNGGTPSGLGTAQFGDVQSYMEAQKNFEVAREGYQNIKGILKPYGLTPESIDAKSVEKLSNADMVNIGKALGRIMTPESLRAGIDTGNELDPTGLPQQAYSALRQFFGGKRYDPSQVASTIRTALNSFNQRATDLGKMSNPSGGNQGGYPKGTDGSQYGHPGYVSDGTQWVLKK